MKETRFIMGMPIELEIVGGDPKAAMDDAFAFLTDIDERFSPYKETSEVARLNRGEVTPETASPEMQEVLALAEETRRETRGYFDIRRPDASPPLGTGGRIDPSGIVKGWAIRAAAQRVEGAGFHDYMLNAGGDIASAGSSAAGEPWRVGIRNPFALHENVQVVYPRGKGVATSGSYIRGAHIYNPLAPRAPLDQVVSLTVIGPDVLAADRFATAAFAMGERGIAFIESLAGFEGYAIDADRRATPTTGWRMYTV
jgi:thiamine biosynthesis lipoprotein